MENNNPTQKEVLLKVEHLEQFFKFGKFVNRAVNDVNFEIYKGEVFGLVGESGCGKTTTGRSIIRLYNITGGSVYFRGHRICAGTRRYKERISQLKAELKARVDELKEQLKDLQAVLYYAAILIFAKFIGAFFTGGIQKELFYDLKEQKFRE